MNRTGAESLSFFNPRLLYCPDQILAVMVLSQHWFYHPKPSDLMLRVVPNVWGMLLEQGLWFVCNAVLPIQLWSETPFVHGIMELSNCSLQVVELNSSCSGQAHSNKPGTGYGYESVGPGCTLTVLCISSVICPLRSTNA